MKERFLKIIMSYIAPMGIAILIAILSYYAFFESYFPKYLYAKVNQYQLPSKITIGDLNEDASSEIIFTQFEIQTNNQSNFSITINPTTNYSTFSQNNFNDKIVFDAPVISMDIDHDHQKEIFIFFVRQNTLVLRGFKLNLDSNITPYLFFEKDIDTITILKNGFMDFIIYYDKPIDVNRDGKPEIAFTINGKYSASPRKVYYYDFVNDSLHCSSDKYYIPISGLKSEVSRITSNVYFFPEGIGSFSNIGDSTIKYHDRCTWVYALNQNLEPVFEPIPISEEGFSNTNYQLYWSHSGKEGLVSEFIKKNKSTTLSLIDFDGNIVKQRTVNSKLFAIQTPNNADKYCCCTTDGKSILFFNFELEIVKRVNISNTEHSITYLNTTNIDKDSLKEYILVTDFGNKIELYDDDLSYMFSMPNNSYKEIVPFKVKTKGNKNFWGYHVGTKSEVFYFQKKHNYYLSYLLSFVVGLLFYFIIQLLFRQRIKTIEKHNKQEKSLIESQLKIANKQMSPHFQLNVLNAISYLFESNKDKAQYYLGKYSRLVSQVMMNVDKIETTLDNEINFTKNFLILEQLRLDNKFDYTIEIDKDIDKNILIPRMSIFTFCENAVKHGLFHLDKQGLLEIKMKKLLDNKILITVEDNGIGRNKSNKLSTHGTGMGLKTLNEIFVYFEKYKGVKLEFELIDKSQGTLVRIIITILV
jgi:hypothetical protein